MYLTESKVAFLWKTQENDSNYYNTITTDKLQILSLSTKILVTRWKKQLYVKRKVAVQVFVNQGRNQGWDSTNKTHEYKQQD